MSRSAGSARSRSRIGSATTIEEILRCLAEHDCVDLSSSIDSSACSKLPHAGGGYCDVYRGALHGGTSIAIKTLRIYDGPEAERDSNSQKILERAARELSHWSKLQHRNVLPLMGLAVFRGQISVISKWMENGSLTSFLGLNQDASRLRICADICEGLCYIHANGLVHGDLKGANVMVAPDGTAMITDFGNTQLKDFTLKFSTTANSSSSVRWTAPELLLEDGDPQVSKEADVYAYGMTVLEVLTGKVPFEGISDGQVLALVAIEKKVPTRPDVGMPDDLWDLLNSCWIREPFERPEITSVRKKIKIVEPPPRIGDGPTDTGDGPAIIRLGTTHICKGPPRISSRFGPPIIVDQPPPPIPNDSYTPYSPATDMSMLSLGPWDDPDNPRHNPSARRRSNAEDAAMSAHVRALEQARKLAAGEDDDEEEEEIQRYVRSKFGDQSGQNYSDSEESEEEETSEEETQSSSLQMASTTSASQWRSPSHLDISYPDRDHDYPVRGNAYPHQGHAYPYQDHAYSYRDNVFPHYATAASASPVTQPPRRPWPQPRPSPRPMEPSPLSEDRQILFPLPRPASPAQIVPLGQIVGQGPAHIGAGPPIFVPPIDYEPTCPSPSPDWGHGSANGFSRTGNAQHPPPLPVIRTQRPRECERSGLQGDRDRASEERENDRRERGVPRTKAKGGRERGFEYGQMTPRGLSPDVRKDIIGSATAVEEIVHALAIRGCPDLTLSIDLGACSDFPCAGGGFCDIYRGTLHDSRGTKIAIKSLRVYDGSEAEGDNESRKILKRAARELYHWSKLHHCNVLPLLGLAIFRGQLTMISEWMEYGNLVSYLRFKPDAHRDRLCMDICEGLCYIHANGMIHGDLKAANVVVSSHGIAMITDFGNTQLKDLTLKFSNTAKGGFTLQWAAPELLLEDSGPQCSKEADVYAYGMTVLETFTSKIPYEGMRDHQVFILVAIKGKVPPRPDINVCNDHLWDLLNSCWAREPSKRPQITIVKSRLQTLFWPSPNSRSWSVRRQFTPLQPSTTERIVVAVTRDAENYVVVELTGHTDAQDIRKRLLSKLHIPAELYSSFSFYRTELGSFTIGTALDDTQLLLACQNIGDNKGSLKFLAQRSDHPTTSADNEPSSRWLRSPGGWLHSPSVGLQPPGLPDFTGFDEEPNSLSRSDTAQPPPLPHIIITPESLSQPGTQRASNSNPGPTDKSPNLGILSSGLPSVRLSQSPVPDLAPAARPDSQHPRTKEREAEKARDREVEKVQQRELEKAREQELRKAKEREHRREEREREKAERRRLAPTVPIAHRPSSPSEDQENNAREKDRQERVGREREVGRATERDAEMVRQRELEETSRREFEKAREREIEKARRHERRREERERAKAERRRLAPTVPIAHKPLPPPRYSHRPSPAKQMGLSPVSEGRQVTHPTPHTVPPPLHIEPPVKAVEGAAKPQSNTAATPITPIASQSRGCDKMMPKETDPMIEIKSTQQPSSVPTLEPEPMNAKAPRAFTFDDPNRIRRTPHAPRAQAGPVPEHNPKTACVYISYNQARARAQGVRTEEETTKRRVDATVGATAVEAAAEKFDRADGKEQKEVDLRTQGEGRASEEQLGREQRYAEAERGLREDQHAEEVWRRESAVRREHEERARYKREKCEHNRQEHEGREEARRRRWAEPTHAPQQPSRSDNVVDARNSVELRWSALSVPSSTHTTSRRRLPALPSPFSGQVTQGEATKCDAALAFGGA